MRNALARSNGGPQFHKGVPKIIGPHFHGIPKIVWHRYGFGSDFGDSDEEASQTQLVFLKASHNEYICNKNGQSVFQFKEVDAQTLFNPNDPYGSLHINHCCFYCVGEYLRKDTDKANFCLIVAKPHTTDNKYTISICLTLDLPTCEKVRYINNNNRQLLI